MYLKELHLWNFRKYGSTEQINSKNPNLSVNFRKGLNVLIGENDSGKTAIIDAIRYLLNTKSFEPIRFEPSDFFQEKESSDRAETFQIVGVFSGFEDTEAANFLEWGYFDNNKKFKLRLLLKVNLYNNIRITWDLKAGPENAEIQMDGNARELLKVTYLKPLRDAETELTPGYRSRLAQILQSHKSFQKTKDENGEFIKHELEVIIEEANNKISDFVEVVKTRESDDSKYIRQQINEYITGFLHNEDNQQAFLKIAEPELYKILRLLGLELEENSSGLGSLNKLFMAAELLHLETDPYHSIRLCLIEELEAHLHPQAQLRVINTLKKIKHTQFILTTHSTTLGSSINLQNVIICKNSNTFPMWDGQTKLDKGDYKFLQRFLNSTKANLFFAKGVIMVEGDAENILIPTIAELIGKPLHDYGVSIVNVGSIAFLRYAKIFMRENGNNLDIPVSIITDLDINSMEYYEDQDCDSPAFFKIQEKEIETLNEKFDLTEIFENYYTNEDEFKDAIKDLITKNKDNKNRMPTGVNAIIKKWEKEILSSHNIDTIRDVRRKTIQSKFTHPVKVFVNKKWTLEYDIALSSNFREYFARSVKIAEKIKSSENYFNEIYDEYGEFTLPIPESESYSSVESWASKICKEGSDLEIAYNIFKPFIGKTKPSKAVTAQIFSEFLLSDKEHACKIIETDPYLQYIVDAINYACRFGNSHE